MVLIFYRGGWCPYCDLHLRGFQRALPELQHFAAQIVAISPQLPDHSLSTQEKDELTFAVLSDRSEADRTGPNNAIIVKQAPQLELLKRTSVCITHAGLNTVLESLAQGVPQVAIPVAYDQPGVAARIAEKQTGAVTSLDKLTVDHLSTLLNEVLNNSTYRDNAHKLQKAIAQANGLSVAADIEEESLGVTEKASTD